MRNANESEGMRSVSKERSVLERRLGITNQTSLQSREDPSLLRGQKAKPDKATGNQVPEREMCRPFPEHWLRIPLKPGIELQLQKQVADLTEADVEALIKTVFKFLIARKGC